LKAVNKEPVMHTENIRKKYIVRAHPPKRLSQEAKQTLVSARPSKKAIAKVASAVKLPVIDGAEVGL
jgi:hypothetical protein